MVTQFSFTLELGRHINTTYYTKPKTIPCAMLGDHPMGDTLWLRRWQPLHWVASGARAEYEQDMACHQLMLDAWQL